MSFRQESGSLLIMLGRNMYGLTLDCHIATMMEGGTERKRRMEGERREERGGRREEGGVYPLDRIVISS